MVVEEHVARVDVDAPGPRTAADIGVGSLESEVEETYAGRVKTTPHPHAGPGGKDRYLTVERADGFATIFETDGTKVTSYRAGKLRQVRWIEGCS